MITRFLVVFLLAGVGGGPAVADTYPRDPNVDVRHYLFRLALSDASDEIVGEATVVVRFSADSLTAFALDLVGRSGNTGMAVEGITEDGHPIAFTHTGDRLQIRLAAPSQAGAEHRYTIAYRGVPADGLIISENKYGDRTFFGDNWPNRAHHWLPTVDHPSDKATVEWIVTAPNHYQVVGNGRIVEETDLPDELRITHWQATVPLATKVMVIGAARFAIQHVDEVAGVPIQSWVYPQDRDPGFYDYARAERIMQFFTSHIGPYPYEKLANVQSKTRFGGMENASNIFYSENAISGTRQNEDLLAHEIAHQWFGDSVTEADWHHIWLSEGFASYFTQLYLENAYGRDRLEAGMQQARSSVLQYYAQAPDSPIVDERITNLMQHLSANSYQKGAWVLHMLRFVVGDEAFWDGIRAYYREYRDGNALTGDFRAVMEAASGRELGWFFDQWIYQPGQPQYEGTWRYSADTGELTVTLNQAQPGGALFSMPVELGIYAPGGGQPRIEVLQVDQRTNTFVIPLDAAPASVELDPNTWLLMEADFKALR